MKSAVLVLVLFFSMGVPSRAAYQGGQTSDEDAITQAVINKLEAAHIPFDRAKISAAVKSQVEKHKMKSERKQHVDSFAVAIGGDGDGGGNDHDTAEHSWFDRVIEFIFGDMKKLHEQEIEREKTMRDYERSVGRSSEGAKQVPATPDGQSSSHNHDH